MTMMKTVADENVADGLSNVATSFVRVRLREADTRVGEVLRDGVVVQQCFPSTRKFHGTSHIDCPSNTSPAMCSTSLPILETLAGQPL
jgi:hypothetical protein